MPAASCESMLTPLGKPAADISVLASAALPDSTASRNVRTAVFSAERTALFRSWAFVF